MDSEQQRSQLEAQLLSELSAAIRRAAWIKFIAAITGLMIGAVSIAALGVVLISQPGTESLDYVGWGAVAVSLGSVPVAWRAVVVLRSSLTNAAARARLTLRI